MWLNFGCYNSARWLNFLILVCADAQGDTTFTRKDHGRGDAAYLSDNPPTSRSSAQGGRVSRSQWLNFEEPPDLACDRSAPHYTIVQARTSRAFFWGPRRRRSSGSRRNCDVLDADYSGCQG